MLPNREHPFYLNTVSTLEYLTLDDAMAIDKIRITELDESGNVPELLLENIASKPVLLVDGEELVGAKQNRVLNLTVLAPANQKIVIPVSCVEAGRWNYSSDQFSNSNRAQFARGRANKMASVSESMDTTGYRHSDQGEVWADIDLKFSRMEMSSDTTAMSDLFEGSVQLLDEYVNAFAAEPNQVGAFFYLHGELAGFDIFDKPETFAQIINKLVRSYAIDVMEQPRDEPKSVVADEAKKLVRLLSTCDWKTYPGTGLGTDCRYTSPHVAAASLVVDGITIHSSGFVFDTGADNDESKSRMASMRSRRRMHFH